MDISVKMGERMFNYRVAAIITHQGRLLAMHDEKSPYYYLPGGRVQMGEEAPQALVREMQEELHITARVVRPLWLVQGFFNEIMNGLDYHELCLYFLVDVMDTDLLSRGDAFTLKDNEHTLRFEWLSFDKLKDEYFFPTFLKSEIYRLPSEFTLLAVHE